jgi:hypothetical protein
MSGSQIQILLSLAYVYGFTSIFPFIHEKKNKADMFFFLFLLLSDSVYMYIMLGDHHMFKDRLDRHRGNVVYIRGPSEPPGSS